TRLLGATTSHDAHQLAELPHRQPRKRRYPRRLVNPDHLHPSMIHYDHRPVITGQPLVLPDEEHIETASMSVKIKYGNCRWTEASDGGASLCWTFLWTSAAWTLSARTSTERWRT